MSTNPYRETRGLFTDEYYRCNSTPPLQPDYSEYEPAEAAGIETDFRRLARAMNKDPRKLLVYGMLTAIDLGYASGVLDETGE